MADDGRYRHVNDTKGVFFLSISNYERAVAGYEMTNLTSVLARSRDFVRHRRAVLWDQLLSFQKMDITIEIKRGECFMGGISRVIMMSTLMRAADLRFLCMENRYVRDWSAPLWQYYLMLWHTCFSNIFFINIKNYSQKCSHNESFFFLNCSCWLFILPKGKGGGFIQCLLLRPLFPCTVV